MTKWSLPVLRRKPCAPWEIGSGNIGPGVALRFDGFEEALVLKSNVRVVSLGVITGRGIVEMGH